MGAPDAPHVKEGTTVSDTVCDQCPRTLSIGRLAALAGVSVKTVRVYHRHGILPEPPRDHSGYRRYCTHDVIALIKARILAQAGVPLAEIGRLGTAESGDMRGALEGVDRTLTTRIAALQRAQDRLRTLMDHGDGTFSPGVGGQAAALRRSGFSERWVALQTDLWILIDTILPEVAAAAIEAAGSAGTDPAVQRLLLDYDRAFDLDPSDSRVADLVQRIRIAGASRPVSSSADRAASETALRDLVRQMLDSMSPAWRRINADVPPEDWWPP